MQWYYLDDQRQQVETDEDGLRRLADSGDLSPNTLVWNDTMSEWTPLKKVLSGGKLPHAQSDDTGTEINPYRAPVSSRSGTSSGNIRALAAVLAQNGGWIKFFGVLVIAGGVFSLPIGAFWIWMGVLLFQVAAQAEEAKLSGSERALTDALEKMGLFFKATAIFLIVTLILMLLFFAALFVFGFFAASLEGMEGASRNQR